MYPFLFTRGRMTKTDVEHDYLDPGLHHVQALLMKAYFLIGIWMLNPKMSKQEADAWKLELSHDVVNTPEALKTFMSLPRCYERL